MDDIRKEIIPEVHLMRFNVLLDEIFWPELLDKVHEQVSYNAILKEVRRFSFGACIGSYFAFGIYSNETNHIFCFGNSALFLCPPFFSFCHECMVAHGGDDC
jgi:hypothetical protein